MEDSESSVPFPYDSYFRFSLANPEIAIPFCQKYLPQSIDSVIDYPTMRVANGSFLSKELQSYASDIILEFDLLTKADEPLDSGDNQAEKLNIAIIIEHQSSPDKFMPLRLMHYMFGYLYQQYTKRCGNELLTPVYPMLFYNGKETPYPYSLDLFDNFNDPYGIMAKVVGEPIPLIDVNQLKQSDLKSQQLLGFRAC